MLTFFVPAIEDLDALLVPSISILEVFKRVLAQRGEREALQAAAQMRLGRVVDLDAALALWAARISLELKVALADSVMFGIGPRPRCDSVDSGTRLQGARRRPVRPQEPPPVSFTQTGRYSTLYS